MEDYNYETIINTPSIITEYLTDIIPETKKYFEDNKNFRFLFYKGIFLFDKYFEEFEYNYTSNIIENLQEIIERNSDKKFIKFYGLMMFAKTQEIQK